MRKEIEVLQGKVIAAILESTYGTEENYTLQAIQDHLAEALVLVNQLDQAEVEEDVLL